MIIGLKTGIVELYDHDIMWEKTADDFIILLKSIFGNVAIDIQHIGSTSIKHIKAKPIIDIIVGINDFNLLIYKVDKINKYGINSSPNNDTENYRFFIKRDIINSMTTHHIHVVKYNGEDWKNRINFRDYLNQNIDEAKKYERLKIELCNKYKDNRAEYTKNKIGYFNEIYEKAKNMKD